ncbi:TauD/TfdA family dioxygenase [Nostocaceae cyanobacterium CENA357]|uniref:TauD/TfdA family dioxygenase n=1 Tax=Atlanticothrix silvestris CENA357 TaxID=1725252 RepID=A0A8J7HGD3_9CYAN|nr:TauD/TfdA family dioxygenase [Atlanticothrix silvestris]MBH8554263.1 TauD/TfdA family dioxygenase [Atlanticothrix silvestris CENA357]
MKNSETYNTGIKKLPTIKRQTISLSQEQLIKTEFFQSEKTLPLIIKPNVEGINLLAWIRSNQSLIETELLKYGGILFRNFNVNGVGEFEQFIEIVSGNLLEYKERSSPRSHVSGNIYTSTDYPANQSIFLHNENSYQQTWPLKIFFFCVTAAQQGGETPIADVRKVYQRISPQVREKFSQRQVMYVRNFGKGFGLPWQTVFQTNDPLQVEEYCRKNDIEVEWTENNCLRTRQIRQAVTKHPKTGEMLWFNHAAFFHISTLEPIMRDSLLAEFSESDLPQNTYYGDGSPIESTVLDEIRSAYQQETVMFLWQQGDILMLDNMLVAHGRAPFVGDRKIVVGMSTPVKNSELNNC